jgi:hypothetical protein
VAVVGALDDVGAERCGVVGAGEPEVGGVGEGEVQQALVALALHELVGAALGPDRLADAAQGPPGRLVAIDELAPRGDDPRRVGADGGHVLELDVAGGHVLELDVAGIAVERSPQPVDLRGADDHEDRLAPGHRRADERQRRGHEAVVTGVEQSFVAEPALRALLLLLSRGRTHLPVHAPGVPAPAWPAILAPGP